MSKYDNWPDLEWKKIPKNKKRKTNSDYRKVKNKYRKTKRENKKRKMNNEKRQAKNKPTTPCSRLLKCL